MLSCSGRFLVNEWLYDCVYEWVVLCNADAFPDLVLLLNSVPSFFMHLGWIGYYPISEKLNVNASKKHLRCIEIWFFRCILAWWWKGNCCITTTLWTGVGAGTYFHVGWETNTDCNQICDLVIRDSHMWQSVKEKYVIYLLY